MTQSSNNNNKAQKRRTNAIRFVYRLHNTFEKQITGFFTWAAFFVTSGYQSIVYFVARDKFSWPSALGGLFLVLVWVVAKFFLGWLISIWIKNTGAEILVPKDGALVPAENETVLTLKLDKVNSGLYDWAKKENISIANELYKYAYKQTIWGDSISKTIARNFEHVSLNSKAISIIYRDTTKTASAAIGFTHIFPINLHTWNKFKSGKMRSIDLQAEEIVRPKAVYDDDKPYGLMILSLVIPNKEWSQPVSIDYQGRIGRIGIDAIAFHLGEYCKEEFKHTNLIPVMFESANRNVKKFFRPYKRNPPEYSKDQVEIFSFDLKNKSVQTIP